MAAASGAAAAPAGDDVDVLTATRDEVRQAISSLDTRLEEQQRTLAAAETAAEAASEAADRAQQRVATAQAAVAAAQEAVREYALEAYIRPPAADALRVLSMSDADDAGYAKNVLKILAAKRYEVVETLVEKQQIAEREQARADRAAADADAAAQAAKTHVEELNALLGEQNALAADLEARLDAALAEAEALAELDRQAATEYILEEIALREDSPAPTPAAATPVDVRSSEATAPTPAGSSGGGQSAAPAPSSPSTTRPTATTRPPSVTTTTRPQATTVPAPPAGVVTRNDVTSVGGILVHKSIATQFRNLLNAANAAGISLGGSGWRDTARQIELRRAHCGPTYYDIYQKPSSQCSPPTAIPGRSMHERGLAVDLTHNGALIRSRSSPAFVWLAANAKRFGFYNLPSEPWHWSTTGT